MKMTLKKKANIKKGNIIFLMLLTIYVFKSTLELKFSEIPDRKKNNGT